MSEPKTQAFSNPFVLNRAEQMGDRLHQYFVSDGLEGLLSNKPLVLEGGRGCGKTMFFLYHSYWYKSREYVDKGSDLRQLLDKEQIIGVYYRADSSFVTAFQHKNLTEQEWSEIFAHYLNLQIAAQILDIVVDLKKAVDLELVAEKAICSRACLYLGNTNGQPDTLESLLEVLQRQKARVVMYINNISQAERPYLIPPGFLIQELAAGLCEEHVFQDKVFQVFLDEFENLLDYQQVLINTFIKGSKPPVVYNIGVRKKGHRSKQTLAPDEIVGEPHDYQLCDLEAAIRKPYVDLLRKMCFRRLKQHPQLKGRSDDDKWLSVESYLGHYDIDDELQSVFGHHPEPRFSEMLRERIEESVVNEEQLETALRRLADSSRLVLTRLNLALLERAKPPSIPELVSELDNYDAETPSKYSDWLHNNKMGLLFLLCHELGERKQYYGFEVFTALSSGIIRYFLELCEHAFQNAFKNDFSFLEPRQLNVEEMDAAAHHVSRYKLNDIETYPPRGPQLKRFILLLGRLFSDLHKDPKQSEPERNHFYTRIDEVSENGREILDSAVMWTVLQEKSATKLKEGAVSYEEVDYHLNRIYAPLFQISYRQKRKLLIPGPSLSNMLAGSTRAGEQSARNVLRQHKIEDAELGPGQLDLWSTKDNV